MGTSLSNAIKRYNLSYFDFEPPKYSLSVPVYSQSFTQDGSTFTILHFLSKNVTIIYLIKINGSGIEAFRKNENIQFRFIFDFCFDHTKPNQCDSFDFQTSAVFSYKHPFIVIPNIKVPFKIGVKYIIDDSDFSIFATLKDFVKMTLNSIPKTYESISSNIANSSKKIIKIIHSETMKDNESEDYILNKKVDSCTDITEQEIQQIQHKKSINQQELQILKSHFSLNEFGRQIPYIGINNLGVTCYISAALNFLSSVTPFVQLVLDVRAKPNTTALELQKIFVQLKMSSIIATRKRQRKESPEQNAAKKPNKQTKTSNETNKTKSITKDKTKTKNENNQDNQKAKNSTKIDSKSGNEIKQTKNSSSENDKIANESKQIKNSSSENDKSANESKQTKNETKSSNEIKQVKNDANKNNNNQKGNMKKDEEFAIEEDEEEEDDDDDMYDEVITPVNSSSSCGNFASISIIKFVSSFGKRLDELVFNEQDTHEFITILFDKIDSELGDDFASKRKQIFGFKSVDFIRCKHVNYGCEITEESNDISLPIVGGCTSIVKSLDKITSKEQMKGDNMWDTGDEKLGKQEVYRYMKFKKIPPFLTFHLMRFTHNIYTMSCEELNNYFDCPEVIDMKKYIINSNKDNLENDDEESGNETRYKLMAIIAHRGSLHSGHYVSYMSPCVNDHWFLFNDSFVSESSFKDVRETYGKSSTSTLFSLANVFHQSNDFYSYLVGYVRFDFINEIRYGIAAPIEFVPNALLMRYSALLLDASNYLNKFDDDENLPKHNLCSIEKPIYGLGKKIEWNDTNETIENLITSTYNINHNKIEEFKQDFFTKNQVFISYPGSKYMLGPLQNNLKASDFIIDGQLSQFIVINAVSNPVFVCKNRSLYSIENSKNIFKKYSSQFTIKCEKRTITAKSHQIPVGSVVTIIPHEAFTLQIRSTKYKVHPQTTYEEIQRKIAENLIQSQQTEKNRHIKNEKNDEKEEEDSYEDDSNIKNNNDNFNDEFDLEHSFFGINDGIDDLESIAPRIIICQGASPLAPRLFRTASSLRSIGGLDFRVLFRPATANSLSLFTQTSAYVVDGKHEARKVTGLWLPCSSTLEHLFEWSASVAAGMSGVEAREAHFAVSSVYRGKIQRIFGPTDENEFDAKSVSRVDVLRTELPHFIEDYERVMRKFGEAPIEARTVLYEPLSKVTFSIGFYYFRKSDTYRELVRRVKGEWKDPDVVLSDNVTVETQSPYFRGYKPKMEAVVFDSLQRIKTNQNFANQRPILTIQVHKAPVKAQPHK